MPKPLIAPGEALRLVLAEVRRLEAETVPLRDAFGRTLAADLASSENVPGFDSSAMDGFAVRAAGTRGASAETPARLRLVGESRAGAPAGNGPGEDEAVRISTGAMVPNGADAVVRIEDAEDDGGTVAVHREVEPGTDIRRAGDDMQAGALVLERGRRIGPAEMGVAASLGAAEVEVARRPRVAVVSTGDELVEPGTPLAPGQIRNSNAYALPAQARVAGAMPLPAEIAPDDRRATVDALGRALRADVAVVTGGVSVGPHDHVKPALAELGVEEVFWGVALRPGKPTWFGVHRRSDDQPALVFGLPGNPVSAMVTFHLFARPALVAMTGGDPALRRAHAVMDADYAKQPGRAHAVRCRLDHRDDGWHVRPTGPQGSHVLTSMLDAQALALVEVERGDVTAGERVEIEIL